VEFQDDVERNCSFQAEKVTSAMISYLFLGVGGGHFRKSQRFHDLLDPEIDEQNDKSES